MTDKEIIIEIAKLDGWTEIVDIPFRGGFYEDSRQFGLYGTPPEKGAVSQGSPVPDYLTSHSAIIPVIEKHCKTIAEKFQLVCNEILLKADAMDFDDVSVDFSCVYYITMTPRQLCIALLKATGKWKE